MGHGSVKNIWCQARFLVVNAWKETVEVIFITEPSFVRALLMAICKKILTLSDSFAMKAINLQQDK